MISAISLDAHSELSLQVSVLNRIGVAESDSTVYTVPQSRLRYVRFDLLAFDKYISVVYIKIAESCEHLESSREGRAFDTIDAARQRFATRRDLARMGCNRTRSNVELLPAHTPSPLSEYVLRTQRARWN